MKRILILTLSLLPFLAWAEVPRDRGTNPTSVIEDSICIGSISGQGCLHADEDIANLVIKVTGAGGDVIFLYDIGTELEDVTAPGTKAYSAPSANNVRVSPQGGAGADQTEIQFADAVYNGEDWITFCITDGQTTIMDFCRTVFLAKSLAEVKAETALIVADTNLLNQTFLNCEVNTANFAGSTSTFACILTDLASGAVTQASNDLEGLQIVVTSGDQIREARFINDTTWDGVNSELQITISRALPATLVDAVTVVVR